MIKDFRRLRQLDLKEVSRSEKENVGIDVSDESDDDTAEEDGSTQNARHSKSGLIKYYCAFFW